MATVFAVPTQAFHLLQGKTATYEYTGDSGQAVTRHFCPTCGAPLFTDAKVRPNLKFVRAAGLALENPAHSTSVAGTYGPEALRNGGFCAVCKVRITAGHYEARKMSRACVSAEEEANGVVLACKVFPRSDLSLLVVGKMTKAVCGVPAAFPPQASRPEPGAAATGG